MSSQNGHRKNTQPLKGRSQSTNGNGHANAELTPGLESEFDLQDLLERVRNGEISSDQALALYRQPAPEDLETKSSNSENETVYFGSEWIASDSLPFASGPTVSGPCVVFDTNESLFSRFKTIEGISRVIVVKRGESYQEVDKDCFQINPAHKADYERVFDAVKKQGVQAGSVINLWPLEDPHTHEHSWFANALYPVFYISQAILKQKPSAQTLFLHVFRHDNTHQHALHTGVSGFARSLHLETRHLVCRAVEVHARQDSWSEWLEAVRNELQDPAPDQAHVVYKQGQRFINRLIEIQPDAGTNPIKDNGVYLITGGLGALGLIFAEQFAKRARVKLVLTGRGELTQERKLSISNLERLGAEVVYWQADVSQQQTVIELIEKIHSRFDRIDGVIHCAGVIRDRLLLNRNNEAVEAVLAPKVAGAVYLDETLKDERLDFFVLFSSLVAVTGNPGQTDYAYANSFLDQFAIVREQLRADQKRHGRTVSINWPLWAAGGMTVSEEAKRQAKKLSGLVPLNNEDGYRAFENALNSSHSQVVVLYGEADKIRISYGADARCSETDDHDTSNRATAPASETERHLLQESAEDFLKSILAREVKLPASKFKSDQALEKYGIDSMMIMNVTRDLEESFGPLPKTLFFEYLNISELASYFVDNHAAKLAELTPKSPPKQFINGNGNGNGHHVIKLADVAAATRDEDIAIIGIGGRYPEADTPDEFWENLKSGKDSITEIPPDRWTLDSFFDPDKDNAGKSYSKWGGFINDVDKFDPLFFNISPREAELMDPQERLFLETAWQTFEDAGYTRTHLSGQKAGVFVGVMYAHYQLFAAEETLKGNTIAPGNFFASIANRVSYFFNLRGPSIALDTLCSSSLTAIHLACESIRRGEIDIALAGGVNVTIHPSKYFNLSSGKFASTDGRCRSFGDGGDGYVPGEGVGAILLKSLSKAVADGDYIYATIKKTAINHGGKTNGVTVPNPNAQSNLIAETLNNAGIDPRKISYLEAHGTGTALGDPIEIAGLTKAFRKLSSKQDASDNQYCAIGSVKSNIGHLESAAGIAGITKVVLQMKHELLAPSLHSQNLNPNIDFESSPFYVQRDLGYWARPVLRESTEALVGPRLAGVSSFGAGGANAHIILEEYVQPLTQAERIPRTSHLILLSARNENRLKAYATRLIRFLKQRTSEDDSEFLANLAFTLQIGREHMQERLAVVVSNTDELVDRLHQFARGGETSGSQVTSNLSSLIEGEAALSFFSALLKSGDLEKLAQVWMAGAEINWEELHQDAKVRRIPLPTYPFARERYWLPTTDNTFVSNAVAKLHPLIDANTSDLEEQKFTTRFSGKEFFLRDHVIKGRQLLPGVAVLEMARAAGELAGKRPVLRVTNTTWNSPFVVTPGSENDINISLYNDGDDVGYEVWSLRPGGSREVNAQGTLVFGGPDSASESIDLKAVLERCPDGLTRDECYRQFEEHGFSYGPAFRAIQELHFNSAETIARLRLPDGLESEFGSFSYHPSLLDGALQSVLGLLRQADDDSDQVYLPFSLGAIEQHQPLSQTVYAHVQSLQDQEADGVRKFDISVVDEAGALLVRIGNFAVKCLGTSFATQTDDAQPTECLLYYPQWQPKRIAQPEIPGPANGSAEVVLVFDTVADVRDALAEPRTRPILIKPGETFADLGDDTYLINPTTKNDYQQLLAKLSEQELHPARILHLWSCRSNSTDISHQLDSGFRSVFNLTQALMQQKSAGWVGLLYVHPDRQPAFEAISALAKTVRLENPKFLYRTLAFKVSELESHVDQVLTEFQNGSDTQVRYDGNERQIQAWTEYAPQSDRQESRVKDDGVYLITGGAGGLGQIFLEYLLRETKARFVLAGRSELSADKEAALRAIDSSGERIMYVQADVSQKEQVESLIATIKSRFGVLNGVFHAAGVTRDAFLLNKSDEEIATVLAPKVYGTQWLDEATATESLDFFVIFSSAAGALGNIGQSDYAYANSFADHFALRREELRKASKRYGKTLSISWPLWEEGGLQTSESSRAWMRQTMGLVPLGTADGLMAFERSLHSPHAQLMVLAGDRVRISQAITGSEAHDRQDEPRAALATSSTHDEDLIQHVDAYLKKILSTELKLPVDKISSREPLEQYGIDSVVVMNLTRELEKRFGELSKTLFFEYRTIAEVTRYFLKHHRSTVEQFTNGPATHAAAQHSAVKHQHPWRVNRPRVRRSIPPPISTIENDDIAIIGISGRYPMAHDLEQFWENLQSGKDCITDVPPDRWSSNGTKQWGGFLDDVDTFDSLFFNISPKEAKLMDPQERLFLETAWHTIEDAGYTRQSLEGIATGVFVGVMYGQYQLFSVEEKHKGTGYTPSSLHASIANRVSYVLNLQGPSIALDTMCSSSLTAIHLACASLRQGDCEVAIAGGVNLSVHPNKYLALTEAKFTSSDGRCRTFGAGGDGYVPGEGVGALMLKRLSKAVADDDHIYGVIKGSAINHGGRTNGYTVPNPTAQAAVIARALKHSNVDPRRISCIEAHGTGTSLGDPIEIAGLVKGFSDAASDKDVQNRYCSIGSVKSNIGHLESAAGIAGITKVLLQLKHGQLVPSLHSAELNPHINFNGSPFFVQQKLEPWKHDHPRQAGISSFGAGGSNAHVIIEEFVPEDRRFVPTSEPQFITLSARTEERLKVYASRLAEFINKQFHPSKSSLHLTQEIGQQVEDQLRSIAADILNLGTAEIDPAEALSAYGADPICFTTLTDAVSSHYDVEINPAVFPAELPSLRAVAQHLVIEHGSAVQKHYSATVPTTAEKPSPELTLHDLAYTLHVGREAMEERLALVVTSLEELAGKLSRYAQGEQNIDGLYAGNVRQSKQRSELLLEGREGVEFVETVIEQRKWQKLAQLWLLGVDIDWRLLHRTADGSLQALRRISLPTYPFARVRHWLPQSGVVQQQLRKDVHPLVQGIDVRQTLRQNSRIVFHKTFHATDPVIKDHVVLHRAILPGVGYLEMAHAALSQIYDANEFHLARIVLLRPLLVADETRVQIVIVDENGLLRFEIQSDDGEPHVRGDYRRTTELRIEAPGKQSIEEIKSRCNEQVERNELYEQFKAVGIEYGPYYQRIEQIWGGDEEAIALLTLPSEYQDELREYSIHPTLLDAALQTIAAITMNRRERNNLVLPFAIERVDVLRPLTPRVYAHVKLIEQDRYHVTVLNEDGLVCVKLHELALKQARAKEDLPEFFYLPVWKPAPLRVVDQRPPRSDRKILLFHAPEPTGLEESIARLHELDQVVSAINTVDSEKLDSWLQQFDAVDEIYFLGGIYSGEINLADVKALDTSQDLGVLSLFRLVKSLIRLGFHRQPLRLNVITNQAHHVLPGDFVNPYAASLFGLVKSLAKEHPLWSITSADVSLADRDPADEESLSKLVKAIAAEPGNPNGDEIALRQGQRYVRSLRPVRLPAIKQTPFREEGVYLILGGAGGIGLELSKHLARSVRARLVLVGRKPLTEDLRREITEIESLGGAVLYLQGDATDLGSMQRVFAAARERFGSIHGVIHSALVLKDKTLANLTEEEFRAALMPKVQGSVNLYLAAANEPLDFLVFFSSAQSFSGNAGQSNYAAGCTFKDSFADHLRQVVPYDVKTINWGYWGEVGVVSSEEYNRRLAAQGVGSIRSVEGIEAIRRILAHPIDQVMPIKLEKHLLEGIGVDLQQTVTLFANKTPSIFHTALNYSNEVSNDLDQLARSRAAFNEVASLGQDLLLISFQQMEVFLAADETYDRNDLRRQLRITPNYYRLLDALLEILDKAGFIRCDGQTIAGSTGLEEPELRARLSAVAERKDQIVASFPEVAPHVELLWTCSQQYPAMLRGEARSTEVIFPDSSSRLVEGVYRGNVVADRCNQRVADTVKSYIEARLTQLPVTEKIRIIEVGAGTGGTSTAVLKTISSYADRIQYIYTDLSTGFIQHGKRHFGATYPFVEFKALDIESHAQVEGLGPGEFDVVIGANVLHATRNLRGTIRNAKRLLKTNGWLVLNEVTEVQDFTTLTFGLLDGWWLFDDPEIRLSGAPLLSPSLWERLLQQEGFKATYTSAHVDDKDLGQHVIIAESNGQTIQPAASPDQKPRKALSPPTSTVPSPAPMVKAPQVQPILINDDEAVQDHVRQTILQCVADALTMTREEIDHDRQFSEYGVDSIIGVDLINVINTTLGLTLRTTALFDYGNVKELAQFIYDEHGKQLTVQSATTTESAQTEDNIDLTLLEKLASGEIGSDQVYQILETQYGQL